MTFSDTIMENHSPFTKKQQMGLTKTSKYTDKQNKIASMAKAIGHPARIAILAYLLKANECINSDLVEELGLAQATISQHLRVLKEAKIIQGTIEGVSVCYCIDPEVWGMVEKTFEEFFRSYSSSQDKSKCC